MKIIKSSFPLRVIKVITIHAGSSMHNQSKSRATQYVIHFYVNKCGFQIDQFWCEYFQPEHDLPDADNHDPDEGPDEMFRFIKVMK